jgi:hypothetical protein
MRAAGAVTELGALLGAHVGDASAPGAVALVARGDEVEVAELAPWNVIGRYGWIGGTGTAAHLTRPPAWSASCSPSSS